MDSLLISIRCPNQSFKDVNVEIESSWTVSSLKSYLQENYPSKPNAKKQRLIYAGQLMKDEQLLSTYFSRKIDDHLPIVHLVCAPSVDQLPYTSPLTSNLRNRGRRTTPLLQQPAGENFQEQNLNQQQQPQPSVSDAMDGQNLLGTFNDYYNNLPADPNWQFAQNAYNVYMMQYMQYLQQLYGATYWPWMVGGNMATIVNQPNVAQTENYQPNAAAPPVVGNQQPQQQEQPRPAEQALNAQGGVDDEDDARNRDWLDWLYMGCRAGLLFMILYFYSSMERFSFVMFCCVLIYGFQAGWFGRRGGDNNNNNNAAQQQQQQPLNNIAEQRQQNNEINNPNVTPPNEIPPPNETPELPQTAWYVFWSTCWTFFSSFFASLVPQRPPPMNVN